MVFSCTVTSVALRYRPQCGHSVPAASRTALLPAQANVFWTLCPADSICLVRSDMIGSSYLRPAAWTSNPLRRRPLLFGERNCRQTFTACDVTSHALGAFQIRFLLDG